MKITVTALDYNHPSVTTDGTELQAIKAFQKKNGLDGINLNLKLDYEGGTSKQYTYLQHSALVAADAASRAKEPQELAQPSFVSVDDKTAVKHAEKGGSHTDKSAK